MSVGIPSWASPPLSPDSQTWIWSLYSHSPFFSVRTVGFLLPSFIHPVFETFPFTFSEYQLIRSPVPLAPVSLFSSVCFCFPLVCNHNYLLIKKKKPSPWPFRFYYTYSSLNNFNSFLKTLLLNEEQLWWKILSWPYVTWDNMMLHCKTSWKRNLLFLSPLSQPTSWWFVWWPLT